TELRLKSKPMTQKGCQKYGKLNPLRRGGQPPQRTRNRPPKLALKKRDRPPGA
ncbi:hypothetical protein TNCV_407751, partial [Trichonephila clavipes]